ncbi:FG-GAP-like repeat-containing protein [Luteolibacter flavescens]|uniref:FG-GAP-like repeat-containing protein n=1 Tax=Luteolibacter flavescens TaxID=1859460 RepID=A0ABT3FPI4_9BACT|nr:FG-GAP-like repeat-containing protein [Luteolibacter flavescens]MCW1885485.1 FG-GAP-like repeat-containing protein [Luteolibacter flavescens]
MTAFPRFPASRFLPGWLSALAMTAGLHAANPDLRYHLRSNEVTFPPNSNYATALADVNHDGKLDMVRTIHSSQVAVALGTGTGTFGTATFFNTGDSPTQVKVARVNGDAHPDIIVGNLGDATISVLLGDGNGGFLPQQVTDLGLRAVSMEIVDFNQDGKADIIATGYLNHAMEGLVTTLTGNGDGTFTQRNTFDASARTRYTMTRSLSVADLNGDSRPDFVVSAPNGGRTVISFLNQGNGTFARHREMQMPGPTGRTALGDFNGDGKTDLAVLLVADESGNLPAGQNVGVVMGNGDGTFGSIFNNGTVYGVNGVAIYGAGPANDTFVPAHASLLATNMDGDGRADLVFWADSSVVLESYAVILRGQADGSFTFGTRKPLNRGGFQLNTGDLDGDGAQDIVSSLGNSITEMLLTHVVPPQFTSAPSVSLRVHSPLTHSITASGTPAPVITMTGNLPQGVNFNPQGALIGNPASGTAGTYPLTFTARNEFGQTATQSFELVVTAGAVPPAITSTNAATFQVGMNSQFNITTTGDPAPVVQVSGTLPTGITAGYSDLHGTAALGSEGTYPLTITARNDFGETVTQAFTLYVVQEDLTVTTAVDEDDGSPDPTLGTGRSLREAINRANSFTGPQTITFSPALAGQTLQVTQSTNGTAFTVTKNLTIRGLPGDEGITLDGNGGSFRMFMVNGNLAISDLTISGCHGDSGSAVFNSGTLLIERCTLRNNRSARSGGAIFNSWEKNARIVNCTITNNHTLLSGAIDSQGRAEIVNTTICGNTADRIAIHAAGLSSSGSANWVTLTNSIVVNNTNAYNGNASDLSGHALTAASSHNLIGTGGSSNLTDGVNGNIVGVTEPGLGELADNGGPTLTFALLEGSPAADAGTVTGAAATDQRGRPRVRFTGVDIGAYERGLESYGTILTAGNAEWYLGPVAIGSELRVYRQEPGQPAVWIGGGLGEEIGKAATGTVLVRRADGSVEARAGSATGAGSAWQVMAHVIAGDGATWFLLNEGGTADHAVYRWAEGDGPVFADASGVQLYPRANGEVLLRNAAGNCYERIGSADGIGSVWQVLAPSLVVTTLVDEDDGASVPELGTGTSLREALYHAEKRAGTDVITFAPELSGTITMSTQWNNAGTASAMEVYNHDVAIVGPTSGSRITLAIAPGVQLRHFHVSSGSSLRLENLTLTGGRTIDHGGSIWSHGALTVRGCTFTGNHAGTEGGAIQSWGESPLFLAENSTFTGNTSANHASALGIGATQATLRHVTISGNTGPNGPLWIYQTAVTMVNSILAGNSTDGVVTSGGNGSGTFSAQSTNNLVGAGGSGGLVNGVKGNLTGVTASQLRLDILSDNGGPTPTMALRPGSIANNGGISIPGTRIDQRGVARAGNTGLLGHYYALATTPTTTLLTAPGALEALTPVATLSTPRIDFGAGTETTAGDGSVLDRGESGGNIFGGLGIPLAVDNVAALWTGFITVPETATYRFTTRSDDGSVLAIDGNVVVDNNGAHSVRNVSGTVQLTAGRHALWIGYYEAAVGAAMQVSWEQIDGTAPFARQIIPPQALSWGDAPDIGAFESGSNAPATPLDDWRFLHGLAANGSQDNGSPSADGVENLLKYAFNMAPDAGDLDSANLSVMPEGGSAGLPRIYPDAQGRLVIEFVRRKAASSPVITYTVETGSSLDALHALEIAPVATVSIDGTWERVTFIDPATGPKRFGRVRVTTF